MTSTVIIIALAAVLVAVGVYSTVTEKHDLTTQQKRRKGDR